MYVKKSYSESFRKEVAKSFLTTQRKMVDVAKEYGVSPSAVFQWSQRYFSDFSQEVSIIKDMRTFKALTNNTSFLVKRGKQTP